MATGNRRDPYKSYRFLVEIDGITHAGFREARIPNTTQEVIEYREGNEPTTPRKLPGLTHYENVTLQWGVTDSMELYSWRKAVEDGGIADARRNMAIVVLDDQGNPAVRWEFSQAWPKRYDAPELSAGGEDVAIETLEIVHEGMERTQ
jgi:phage tail-like protein